MIETAQRADTEVGAIKSDCLALEVDVDLLRRERLANVQREMARHDIAGLLLINPINIRYVTDVSVMHSWTAVNMARYAFVPAVGAPTLFEYGHAVFRAERVWPHNSRVAKTWQFRFSQHEAKNRARDWASDLVTLMREQGSHLGLKIGIDTIDFYGFRALEEAGLTVCDADQVMQDARLIKTPGEVSLLRESYRVAEMAVRDMERAIRPGITENELLATFYKTMLTHGAEHSSTRLLSVGDNTNPWFNEASFRKVEPGDVVGIDTDMIGPEGYLCDFSRTFVCGDSTNSEQKENYKVAYNFIHSTIELLKPGVAYRDVCFNSPKFSKEYEQLAYSCMLHGIGMDDEPPFLPYRHAIDHVGESVIPDGELQPGMMLCVEFYAGKTGGRDGVKLEEQVLITENGAELISTYALDSRFLN